MKSILFTLLISLFVMTRLLSQTIEAENGELAGTQKATVTTGFTGTGYVTGFDADGDKVTMSRSMSEAGIYKLYIRYASASGDKFNYVYVNGLNIGSAAFPKTATFRETMAGKIYLKQGVNTIAIVKDWGYVDVDNIRLEKSELSDIHRIADALVTANPSTEADSIYRFLSKAYGKVVLSGQYGGATELNKISTASGGKKPLIRGFDLMDYSPTRVSNGASSSETENAIAWHQGKGLVTFAWHWNAPKDLIDEPGKEWWRGFYTYATTFDVTKAMNDNTSEEYNLILSDIDAIAIQLKKLQDARVPVLWRPLHEAEGEWFWWGAKGPEACKWLWKLLFDRLVNHHEINNLIWVWTSTGNPAALDWYPGDDYVDVIGADIYLPAGTYSSSLITFDNMVSLYEGRKIIALSENGPIPDPESLFNEGAAWSWFSTWSGDFILDGNQNTSAHISKVFNHDYVITHEEVKNLDQIIEVLEERKDDGIVLSVREQSDILVIHQNPIHNTLKVTLKDPGTKRVSIYTTQGKLLQVVDMPGSLLQIDFTDRPAGVYVVRVVNARSVETFRIVKL